MNLRHTSTIKATAQRIWQHEGARHAQFLLGYGVSACGGLVTTLLLARHFGPKTFGPLGLLFTLGTGIPLLAAGFDAACTRVIAANTAPTDTTALLRSNGSRRLWWVVIPLIVTVATWRPGLQTAAALSLFCLGQVILSQRLILPIARGQTMAFVSSQAAWSAALIAPVVIAVTDRLSVPEFLNALIASLGLFALVLGGVWSQQLGLGSKRQHVTARTARELKALGTMGRGTFLAGLFFVIYDRMDPVVVSSFFGGADLGKYLAAVRVASVLTLITAASQAALTRHLVLLSQRSESRFFSLGRRVGVTLVVCAALFVMVAAIVIVPVLGAAYSGTPQLIVILALEYVIFAAIVAELVALPVLTSPRIVVLQAVVPMIVKLGWLMILGTRSLTLAAVAAPVGALASAAIAVCTTRRQRARGSFGAADDHPLAWDAG